MSYDVDLCTKDVDGNGIGAFAWNYTSNCAPMWRRAGANLAAFDGMVARDVAPILAEAIACMKANPQDYTPMNPRNGWGSYDTLIPALQTLHGAMVKYPSAIVGVSW